MEARPVAPPPANVAKADPEPTAVEFLMAELPVHVQAFLAEVTFKGAVPT
ncbi:hypothetical protein OVY01_15890 [Robbsia sp. Bb-Pol-6]|uniref:Uncharacterized protein n=1 Tax=Robbsia betulipollinis TaxID=2981849 RepID=A0ABT3ZQ27_9BURK|nr:hypothetical protein [Robbsia betulipollinis]MCY0388663.1 hypothetical protein [Robbsia betulipollinis]